jgi:chorismate synthase
MTFGESHGPFIGVVIDGIQPGIPIDISEIQKDLDRRRPGQSSVVTPRKEKDRAEVVSGIFEGKTTGTPVCILIRNQDQRSKDYRQLEKILRPGHASYTFLKKYGIFDFRGGGRASGRETATRVAAGAVAKQLLKKREIEIIAYTRQIGNIEIETVDLSEIENNIVRAPDSVAAKKMTELIVKAQEEGDSLGGVIEVIVKNCPPGLGEPVFNKLEADLSQALMSIGAVKAFEMGEGFRTASMKGSTFNDAFYFDSKISKFRTRTNHAGGVLGGISNGEDLIMRIAVKPPSSISKEQDTVDLEGKPTKVSIGGRHDPCICPRIVPVAEAMVALVLIDQMIMQERLSSKDDLQKMREKVDLIDTQLLMVLVQRRRLIEKIAQVKKAASNNVLDEEREAHIINKWKRISKTLDIPEELAQILIKAILKDSHRIQEKIIQ